MAITNAMIVFTHQQELLEAGKIKPTGRMIEIETAEGTQMIPEAEAINTYGHWQELGYQVRKGEKAIADFPIWKYTIKAKDQTEEEAQEKGYCFMKKAFWFSASQVDRIRK